MANSLGTCKALELNIGKTSRAIAPPRTRATTHRQETSILIGHKLYFVGRVSQSMQGIGVLDVNTWQWTMLKRNYHPLHRNGFTTVLVGDELYLFSGFEASQPLRVNFTRTYDPVLNQLRTCHSRGEVNVPTGESAGEYIEDLRMIVAFGGVLDSGRLVVSRVVGYSIDANEWIVISTKGQTPSARTQHRSCLYGSNDIFFYGGRLQGSLLYSSTVCHLRCDPGSFTWHHVDWLQSPKCHYAASMNFIDGRIIILGGSDDCLLGNPTSYVYVYDFYERVGVEFNNGYAGVKSGGGPELDLGLKGFPPYMANHSAAALKDRLVVTGLKGREANEVFVIKPL